MIAEQTSLTREQKEAVGLLSIGTFLEYFDLMLYVHMAVLLNELFFPKTDPFTASLLSALAFCSTYFLRPFAALIFGYIGDNIGRKHTVVITTFMMAASCIIMANLPTYEQIGISAAWVVTICRIIQGMSSMGESIGAELYLTEITKPPVQYPIVSLIPVSIALGSLFAIALASIVTMNGLNWRVAFWIGGCIAIIGTLARMFLRETPEFVNAKKRLVKLTNESLKKVGLTENSVSINSSLNKMNEIYHDKKESQLKISLSLFAMQCNWPLGFYIVYIYSAEIYKTKFLFTAPDVIHNNLLVSIIQLVSMSFVSYLSYRIYPLKILRVKLVAFAFFILFLPFCLFHLRDSNDLLLLQMLFIILLPSTPPAVPILFKCFSVFTRFTYTSVMYAISRALIYVVTSFGIIYLSRSFEYYGLLILLIPAVVCFYLALNHFDKLITNQTSSS
ncbi:MAG: MHS family MFS transporter [Alphaproteobacteria bacterium]|nr:MHS family MFS transporter [Alphaproteobacteria bacterium]